MVSPVKHDPETLPAFAVALREWMPQLGDRAIAVSDGDVTSENVPTLPLAIVAPLRQNFTHVGQRVTVEEIFTAELWLEPAREKSKEGESPFWSYYPFNRLRNQLFNKLSTWRSPQNGTVALNYMDFESSSLATVVAFRLTATYDICRDDDEWEAPAEIVFDLCPPKSPVCKPGQAEEKDPCHAST
jgi:hypothetical protein